jgi:hypothetical protein
MERRNAIDSNNQMAAQAAEQQARQFDEQMKLEHERLTYGALDSPYGGQAARDVQGWDEAKIAEVEKQAADAANAAIFQQKSAGLGQLGQAGAVMPSAGAEAGMPNVQWGERPDVGMNNADNRAQLEQAEIAAAASRYGADKGLAGAQARANADAAPRVTSTVPGGATGVGYQVQGTDVGRVQSTTDELAGRTGRPTRAENVAAPEQQSAWGPGLKAQALSKGYTVDEGAQVQFIENNGQRVPAIVATRPDGSKVYITGAPGG